MFCGIDSIMWNILIFSMNVGIFHIILSILQNIVMDMKNVMSQMTCL